MSVAHELRKKYGLAPHEPTSEQTSCWSNFVQSQRLENESLESAGIRAAKHCFPSYGTFKYASRPKTVADLLRALGEQLDE